MDDIATRRAEHEFGLERLDAPLAIEDLHAERNSEAVLHHRSPEPGARRFASKRFESCRGTVSLQ